MRLSDIPTPAAVIDRPRFEANCRTMLERCRSHGVRLRPHMKTMKSIEAARIALGAPAGPIAVATLREAEHFAAHGFSDIFYAVCVTPDKLARCAAIARAAPGFSLLVDSMEAAAAVIASGTAHKVWIEMDCGEHRTGLPSGDPAVIGIARALSEASNTTFAGVATHGGQAYGATDVAEIVRIAERERAAVVDAAARIRAAGGACPDVSAGSTPTAVHGRSWDGVTELRAGVYMAGDLFQAGIGSCAQDALAFSVLATVIARNTERRQVVVDAGGLALSKDRSTAGHPFDAGYGLMLDIHGKAAFGALKIDDVHQEHGELRAVPPAVLERLAPGTRVRILPNHACMTAAMYERLNVVAGGGDAIDAIWDRVNGW
jgi:D-serine deaminase-like pyridoxal phosphate-dependent protein